MTSYRTRDSRFVGPMGAMVDLENITAGGISHLMTLNYDSSANDITKIAQALEPLKHRSVVDVGITMVRNRKTADDSLKVGLLFDFFSYELPRNGKIDLAKYAVDMIDEAITTEKDSRFSIRLANFCLTPNDAGKYAMGVASKRGFDRMLEGVALNKTAQGTGPELGETAEYALVSLANMGQWNRLVRLTFPAYDKRLVESATKIIADKITLGDLKNQENPADQNLIKFVCLNCNVDLAKSALNIAVENNRLDIVAAALGQRREIITDDARNALMGLIRD